MDIETLTAERDINRLAQGWIYRDLGQWDRLRQLFHPDGTIAVSWFEGPFAKFVSASEQMGASDLRSKHVIGSPVIDLAGNRAIAETRAIILGENRNLKLGCNAFVRFYDLVERRDAEWKIFRRDFVYDLAAFTFPRGPIGIDAETLDRYPPEYAAMAYLLEKSGFPVRRIFPTGSSEAEKTIRADGHRWLKETKSA
jgi:SnoaL-like domain